MLDLTDITSAGGLSIVASVAVLVGKLTFLLGLAFLGERVLRRASAGSRHSLWSLMIASALLLPGLAYLLPATPVAFLPARTADRIAAILQNASSVPSNRSAAFTNPIDSSPSTGETTVAGRATSGSPFEAGDRAASTAGEQALGELSSERAGDAGGGPGSSVCRRPVDVDEFAGLRARGLGSGLPVRLLAPCGVAGGFTPAARARPAPVRRALEPSDERRTARGRHSTWSFAAAQLRGPYTFDGRHSFAVCCPTVRQPRDGRRNSGESFCDTSWCISDATIFCAIASAESPRRSTGSIR